MDLLDLIPAGRQGSQYSREQIIQAATYYVTTGSATRAAAMSGVHDRTIYDWRNAEWWEPVCREIRAAKQDELDGALTDLIHKAVSAATERIESGDHRLVKRKTEAGETCELVRVPVSARDCAIVAAISADKRQIVRGQATEIIEHSSDKLTQLREQLRQLSGRTIEGAVIEKLEAKQEVSNEAQVRE